jgi:flagellar hook assembly protein FlgD
MAFPRAGRVTLTVFDAAGRVVRTLLDGTVTAGAKTIVWDGADDGGRQLSSGVYLYRLDDAARQVTRRLVLIR